MQEINIKRAYDPSSPDDGYRIYIDRLWPRGLSHEQFHYDYWDKEISPSSQLREWFHEDPGSRWDEFEKRYSAELKENKEYAALKKEIKNKPVVTLIYSSHDHLHNNAVVLQKLLTSDD